MASATARSRGSIRTCIRFIRVKRRGAERSFNGSTAFSLMLDAELKRYGLGPAASRPGRYLQFVDASVSDG